MAPLFSIGVTTFDRDEMLKDALSTILAQTFSDYEVIVSNDNPKRKISNQSVGIYDSRFKFINQSGNLGEIANMNYLLQKGTGRYFTWICDDDLYVPDFLESVYKTLVKHSFPKCVFTSFEIFGDKKPDFYKKPHEGRDELFDGQGFFYSYSKGKANTLASMGVFERKTLQAIGGLEDISGDGKGMFCEYMLLVRSMLLERVAYIDKPLVLFRFHEGSWGCTSTDLEMYHRATDTLTRQSIEIFKSPRLKKHFYDHLFFILNLAILGNLGIMSRRARFGDKSLKKIVPYLIYSRRYIDPLKGSGLYLTGLIALLHAQISAVLHMARSIIVKRLQIRSRK